MTTQEMMSAKLIVADLNTMSIWNFATDETANAVLARAKEQQQESIATWTSHIKNYPNRKDFVGYLTNEKRKNWKIMTYDEYKKAERERLLGEPLKEITKETFEEMLDVLPPLKWCTRKNIEMFCMSEMWTGTYTNQYAYNLVTGKYYTKMVDAADKSTWICELL